MMEIAYVKKYDKPDFETARILNIHNTAFWIYCILDCLNAKIFPCWGGTQMFVAFLPIISHLKSVHNLTSCPASLYIFAITLPSILCFQLWFFPLDCQTETDMLLNYLWHVTSYY
jgi:hypothetical protein